MRPTNYIAATLFLAACFAILFMLNALREGTETFLNAIAASVPIWAIFLSIFIPYAALENIRIKEKRKRQKTKVDAVQIVIDGVAVYAGMVKVEQVSIEPAATISSRVYAPYRPYLDFVEQNPAVFDRRHLSIISMYESLLWVDMGKLKKMAERQNIGDNLPRVREALANLDYTLEEYDNAMSRTEEEHAAWSGVNKAPTATLP